MTEVYLEKGFEEIFIKTIEDLGYERTDHNQIIRESKRSPLAAEYLREALAKLNPDLGPDLIDQAVFKINNIDAGLLVNRNEIFFEYLQNGIELTSYEDGETKTRLARLIDYENPEANSFVVSNQLTIEGKDTRRPDVLIYVNGLPLVVIELKSLTTEFSDIDSAYRQIKNYQKGIEELFVYNAFNIISDFTKTKVGTITANMAWYKEWKSADGSYESKDFGDYITPIKGLLDKRRFLDIIRNFIFFEHKDEGTTKIMAQYHQYFAVRKALKSTVEAIKKGDGRGGVFWHTQGSGKSLSMVFYSQYLIRTLDKPTFVIITDRNDLDNQLYGQFARASKFLRQEPIQAKSREDLYNLLDKRKSNGIFFSTMQKFQESDEPLSLRNDIIVISDEAHRSQYGLKEKISKDGHIQIGMARLVRDSLPNATYIGFTGTPISDKDKDTKEVFGSYIDIYDMNQAVKDGATKPVYYENRVLNLFLDKEVLNLIDLKYKEMEAKASSIDIENSKKNLSRLERIVGSDEAIDTLVRDIIDHYEKNRADLLTGKALLVAYNRRIAIKIYRKILELRPDWKEKVKVIATSSNNDPEDWKDILGFKTDKEELAKRFKDDDDPFKIAIVVDMWLTGFDVPSLSTMYVYKPMEGYNLMQAIARVNRVFEDKEGGLVVDYIGIADALRKAISEYNNNGSGNGGSDIRDTAYPVFKEKLITCRGLVTKDFKYQRIFNKDIEKSEMAELIKEGINSILSYDEKTQEDFKKEAYVLKQAHSLCGSLTNEKEQREAAFIEAIRISVMRITSPGKMSRKEIDEEISTLLDKVVESRGVIDIFQNIGGEVNLFDRKFLANLAKMKQKNLSIKLLEKLISDEIIQYVRTDKLKSEEFSDKLKRVMERYKRGLIANAKGLQNFTSGIGEEKNNDYDLDDIIKKLLDLADEMVKMDEESKATGLSKEELAFYHAIRNPENIKDLYTDEDMIRFTRELSQAINQEMTPDWSLKQSGRASMRLAVKRLLRKYKYPKDEMDKVVKLIIDQAQYFDEAYGL